MSNCLKCSHFNNQKFVNDTRTKNAGICEKFCEVVFYNDKACNQYLIIRSKILFEDIQIGEIKKPLQNNHKEITNQLELFLIY
jgi:hypothetical protein